MKKMIYSEDFKIRINNAIKNNSIVAKDLWKAINTPDNVRDGVKTNFITTKRVNKGVFNTYTVMNVKITCCNKDFTNENNPEHGSPVGMWRNENRSDISIMSLLECFSSIHIDMYSSEQINYFVSVLALNEPVKISIVKTMKDMTDAYDGQNYVKQCESDAPLQKSCMRYQETSAVAGDFYANFAGTQMIVAKGVVSGEIYGRAILWPSITVQGVSGSFMDRNYFSHDCIRVMFREFAEKTGVTFMKKKNTYSDKLDFIRISDKIELRAEVNINVPVKKWHKGGSPYVDTFSYLYYKDGQFVLNNYDKDDKVASLDREGECASTCKRICPICGKTHTDENICYDCQTKYIKVTEIGNIYTGKVDKNRNPILNKKFVANARRLRSL